MEPELTQDQERELNKRFTYHPPQPSQPERYTKIRETAKEFAKLIMLATPASREQSLALTKLDEVVMHANSAIARNEYA